MDETLMKVVDGERVEIAGVDINKTATEFIPQTKRNICYIVGGLVFNENGEILMTQEAKKSCYGKWYLPLGRLEPGETFQEGAIREVLEETGIVTEPITMLLCQQGGGTWWRIMFLMKQTGGTLKTVPDAESLKGAWFHPDKVLNKELDIRAPDILPLIRSGLAYRQLPLQDVYQCLPVVHAHHKMIHRVVHIAPTAEGDYAVLLNTEGGVHLPSCVVGPDDMSLMVSIFRLFQDAFSRKLHEKPNVLGVLSVEYCGKPAHEHDGMCITTLVHTKKLMKLEGESKNYSWHVIVKTELISKLTSMLQGKCIVPFLDVHCKK